MSRSVVWRRAAAHRTSASVTARLPAAACAPCLLCFACFGTPTPLAPGLTGSVGAPHHGVITDAVELPEQGPGFVRYRRKGEEHWGSPRLVRALQSVAADVARKMPGGAPLVIGDLSSRFGGKIPRHDSHRTGRDVDLPWFVTTPEGIPIRSPGFVRVGADGLAKIEDTADFVRLDVPREWLLVKELVTSRDVDVEWLFCSHDVEGVLIDYARARGEPPDVVWRAETVLREPGDSLPHDDHLHLRISCSPEETVLGCEGGPRWEWLPPLPELATSDTAIYDAALDDPPAPLPEDADSAQGG